MTLIFTRWWCKNSELNNIEGTTENNELNMSISY